MVSEERLYFFFFWLGFVILVCLRSVLESETFLVVARVELRENLVNLHCHRQATTGFFNAVSQHWGITVDCIHHLSVVILG